MTSNFTSFYLIPISILSFLSKTVECCLYDQKYDPKYIITLMVYYRKYNFASRIQERLQPTILFDNYD